MFSMQRTISQSIRFSGIGLHSGKKVNVRLLPHNEHGGVVFRRTDITPHVDVPALATNVSDTTLSSCLSVVHGETGENVYVRTVEHFMSALAGVGIDNLIIEISADEVPIMDGSAAPFVRILESAGIVEQLAPKRFIKITQPVSVTLGDKKAELKPYDGFRINFEIDFSHPTLKQTTQSLQVDLSEANFIKQVSEARTFGFLKDIEYLRANNLALGGSLENAIVLDEEKVLNDEGLRFDDEFVRHKVLDAVGDLYLAGYPILGDFTAFKSGHHLNNLLVRQVLASPSCYEMVSLSQLNYDASTMFPPCVAVAEAS